jgi:hypothetical protein
VARQVLLMMNLRLDDVVRLRKRHPCGGDEWRVVRLGADIGAICATCGRRVMMPRSKFEKQIKQVLDRGGEFKRPD